MNEVQKNIVYIKGFEVDTNKSFKGIDNAWILPNGKFYGVCGSGMHCAFVYEYNVANNISDEYLTDSEAIAEKNNWLKIQKLGGANIRTFFCKRLSRRQKKVFVKYLIDNEIVLGEWSNRYDWELFAKVRET